MEAFSVKKPMCTLASHPALAFKNTSCNVRCHVSLTYASYLCCIFTMSTRHESDNVSSAKSQYVSDAALKPFLSPSFNPADFLNANLPQLSVSSTSSQPLRHAPIPLAELSTQTQTLLSHLGAHTTRLSSALTQLTDEILRSSSRLAYEVEVLRGETLGLSETLTDNLKDDIE